MSKIWFKFRYHASESCLYQVHCRWRLEAKEETSSVIEIRVGK